MSTTSTSPLTNRPTESDWERLIEDWAIWAGDYPVRTHELYDRVAVDLEGFQFETLHLHDGKLTRFGMELKKRRDQTIGDMVVRSTLRDDAVPYYWLEPVGMDYSGDRALLDAEARDRLFEMMGMNLDREFFLGMSDIDLEDHRATRNKVKRG